MVQGEGPFKVLERIGGNGFKLDITRNMHVSATFSVGD